MGDGYTFGARLRQLEKIVPRLVDSTKSAVKNMVKDGLRARGLRLGNHQRITDALFKTRMLEDLPKRINFLRTLPPEVAMELMAYLPYAHSQSGQDPFALSQIGPKRDGYFVEFGATDGVNISNSYFFEKHLGWKGIVAEPARMWHHDIAINRNCHVETQCVWSSSGAVLQFSEVAELSTLSDFAEIDHHAKTRQKNTKYDVRTISLDDLLTRYDAPRHIDYLSIDTEGSEFDILNAFDFTKHTFGVITCEHNHTPARDKIHALLSSHGYRRVMEDASGVDDWYVGQQLKAR